MASQAGNVVKAALCLGAAIFLFTTVLPALDDRKDVHTIEQPAATEASLPIVTASAQNSASTEVVATPTGMSAAEAQMPDIEKRFIFTIKTYADAYRAAANDMAKGATRPARAKAICALPRASDKHGARWTGVVSELSSTSSGKGILTLQIADGVTMGTTNNEFSNALGDKTLLEPGTPVYQQAVALKIGQAVSFTARFPRSEEDCLKATDMTQEGAMMEPDWETEFQSIQPIP